MSAGRKRSALKLKLLLLPILVEGNSPFIRSSIRGHCKAKTDLDWLLKKLTDYEAAHLTSATVPNGVAHGPITLQLRLFAAWKEAH